MSAKTCTKVLIGEKIYTLSGYEGEEYLQKVASYINGKLDEFKELEDFKHAPLDMKATLVEINIADDYFKAKSQVEKLEQELEQKEKEIYELKHDLVSNQVKTAASEKELQELKKQNQELLRNKAKLEASLEEALLGKVSGQEKTEE